MMQLGVHFANFAVEPRPGGLGETLAETVRTAEAGGCAWFTMMDHWFQMEQMGGGAGDPMLEGYTSLGFVAGQTRSMTLSLLVTGVTYRHPGLLAKIVTTLDVLSGGRAMLGIGAAWYEREHLGLGVPYPPVAERFERLEETLQICQQMWGPDNGPFAGRHYQLAETLCVPAPVHQPRPPIMIGGTGEKKTLRLVAKYAEASNMFALGVDALAAKLDTLARHCEAEGRDPATIRKTILGGGDPIGDPDGFLRSMEGYAKLGVDLVEVVPVTSDPVGFVAQLGETIVPRLAQIPAN